MAALQHEISGKDRILLAARDLFAAKGFHQTPIAELATSAGVSVGQIYRLFKGKEEIIDAIVEKDAHDKEQMILALRARLEAGEIDIVRTFELMLLKGMDNPYEALTFDILAEAHRNPRVGATITAMCEHYREALGEFACIANPDLAGDALKSAEEIILATLFGLGHRSLSAPTLGREDTARSAAQMIVAALRSIR
ncbi:TetR/AcrR family transcriptional regulator [Sphingobium bisphenolivorans]|uniref:TetR/AcrR family transcriptional regulator n=1 Tax=Sphingobium bisphenolivorans TaxID=1335760 RepID=UPI0004834AE9|nr:TetR/AcrR family transcriptional regulator [Sphingobium bisphenolivorans]